MEKDREWWDNEARLKALGKGHNSPFYANDKKLDKVVEEKEGRGEINQFYIDMGKKYNIK